MLRDRLLDVRAAAAVAVISAALVVAACGGGATAAPAGNASAPPSAAATTTPTPETSAPPSTFTAANGRTIQHPDGWYTREDLGIVYLATTQAAADRLVAMGSVDPGQLFVQFSENSILDGSTSDPAVHLPDSLRLLLEGAGLTARAPVSFTSAGRPAARIDAANDRLAMLAASVRVRDDLFADVIAYTAPGEMAAHEAEILALIDSLTYPPT